MKKTVCVLLAVLVLMDGATAFAADGNSVILGEPIIGAAAGEYEKTIDALLAAQGQA